MRSAPSLVVAALMAWLLAGCSSGGDEAVRSTQPSVTSAAQSAINSTLITLKLPPGTKISSHSDGVEIWQIPGSQEQAVSAVKPQLPIGREFEGLKWCKAETNVKTGLIDWVWGRPGSSIMVGVFPDATVRIEKTTNDPVGCGT